MEASTRAIVSADSTCPELQLGDETVQMQVRAEPGPSVLAEKQAEFPVRVCEAIVPAAERKITLEGVALPVPAAEFKRIVIVGDTGRRIKKKNTQDCNDPKYWPYPRLANQAADARPDLVIHAGDYLYREKSCEGGLTNAQNHLSVTVGIFGRLTSLHRRPGSLRPHLGSW
jgi:hypothetical protein